MKLNFLFVPWTKRGPDVVAKQNGLRAHEFSARHKQFTDLTARGVVLRKKWRRFAFKMFTRRDLLKRGRDKKASEECKVSDRCCGDLRGPGRPRPRPRLRREIFVAGAHTAVLENFLNCSDGASVWPFESETSNGASPRTTTTAPKYNKLNDENERDDR